MSQTSNVDDVGDPYTPVERALDEVSDSWTETDPKILALPGDGCPAVAVVRGDVRVLSYRFVYPRDYTRNQLRNLVDRRGDFHVMRLSEHPAGYRKEMFRNPASSRS